MSLGFDLVDLRLFLQVIETGSITAGAQRAHLALASASARIRGMEERLGTPLLVRAARGVHGTAAGCALAAHARLILEQEQRMRGELRQYAQGLKGHIRLLANTAAVTEFLPEALASFLAAHADIDIELEQRQSCDIVQAVAEGVAEVGIAADSTGSGALQTFPFRQDRLVVVTAPEHPLLQQETLSLGDLLPYEFIGLDSGSALHAHLDGHAARIGKRLRYRVRLHDFDDICRMVEQNVGISVIPEAAALRCRARIRPRPLREGWAQRRLLICVRAIDELPVHTRQLIAHLREGAPPLSDLAASA